MQKWATKKRKLIRNGGLWELQNPAPIMAETYLFWFQQSRSFLEGKESRPSPSWSAWLGHQTLNPYSLPRKRHQSVAVVVILESKSRSTMLLRFILEVNPYKMGSHRKQPGSFYPPPPARPRCFGSPWSDVIFKISCYKLEKLWNLLFAPLIQALFW